MDTPEGVVVGERRRPRGVWAVCIFYGLSSIWTAYALWMTLQGAVPLTEGQRQYFATLTLLDHALTLLCSALTLAGAVMLFVLRRRAFHLLASGFAVGVILTAYQTATHGWLRAMGGPGLVGALMGWAMAIWILTYVHGLGKRGVLV